MLATGDIKFAADAFPTMVIDAAFNDDNEATNPVREDACMDAAENPNGKSIFPDAALIQVADTFP